MSSHTNRESKKGLRAMPPSLSPEPSLGWTLTREVWHSHKSMLQGMRGRRRHWGVGGEEHKEG